MGKDSRAIVAFILGLIGGLAIVVSDLAFYPQVYYYGIFFGLFGFYLSLVAGLVIIGSAALVFQKPAQGVMWGTVMIVFAALSIGGAGGFVVGLVLSIVAGGFAIVAGASPSMPAAGAQRACLSCGMLFATDFAHCPHCGHPASRPPGTSPPPP